MELTLRLLDGNLAVARLDGDAALPAWLDMNAKPLACVMRTGDELSIVCTEELVPEGVRAEKGWRAFRIVGQIDFALTGVLASVLHPLAEAKVGIFALSTFDTDYILVRSEQLEAARVVLAARFRIVD
ncbi:MAG: ACT domain-containing protein [Acidobacteriota bacterium]|nr:ACT domain-containing protein [Acidobacteriota bacterium]